jgi:hypothetical protein
VELVTRAEWGARRPKNRLTAQLTGASTGHWNGPTVVVGGRPDFGHEHCASLVRGIQNFHMDSRGWSDIAYNFVICPHGYTFEGRGLNVINGANGTNAANRSSHAIMWMAGGGNAFSDSEKLEFRQCVKYVDENTLAPDAAVGHRDHKSTECPGNERYGWIHDGMPVSGGADPTPPRSNASTSHGADMYAITVNPSNNDFYEVWVEPDGDVMFRSGNVFTFSTAVGQKIGVMAKAVAIWLDVHGTLFVSCQGEDDKIHYTHFQSDWTWAQWQTSENVALHP